MHKHRNGKRLPALCLAVLLLAACLPFAAAQEPAEYKGAVLMAVNTDRNDAFSGFTTDRVQPQNEVAAAEEQPEDKMLPDAPLDDPEPLSPAQALLRQAQVGDTEPQAKAEYRVGDRKQIFSHYAVSEHRVYRTVDMVCTSVSDTVTVWRESGTENDHVEDDAKLAREMDERLPKELEFFGDKRIDTDGDGKTAVFLYKIDGVNIGGYFTVSDLMDGFGRIGSVWHPYLSASNHMDCIHVQGGRSYSFIAQTCLHEYQHYIQASYRYVGRNNFTALRATETFINEGFSTGAEFLLYGVDRYSDDFTYAARPSKRLSFLNWEHDNGNYSMAFVFSQYIRTRYAALTDDLGSEIPGGGIYKKILESRTPKNDGDTMALIADILYPAADYPQLRDSEARCRQLLCDFWQAVFCQEPEGVHGFNGENWVRNIEPKKLVQPMPAGRTNYSVRSGMAAFYQIADNETDTVRIVQSDEWLTFAVPAAPGYTLRFNTNGGSGAPQAQALVTDYLFSVPEDSGLPSRSGCTFLGWAQSADAAAAQYNTGDRIRLTADTTLYAVWQQSPDVVTDTPYPMRRQGRENRNNYRFVPETDGIYKLTFAKAANRQMHLSLDGTQIEEIYSDASSDTLAAYYRLTGGTAYDLCLDMTDSWNSSGTFSLTRQEVFYTLTYRLEHPLAAKTWSYACATEYTADAPEKPILPRFLGWAFTKDAQTPEILPGEKLTITEDTTLFAVCAPETVLTTDGVCVRTPSDSDTFLYILQPETDGMYALHWQMQSEINYIYAQLLDAHGTLLLDVRPDDDMTCALRGGETYYLYGLTDAPEESASCTKTSDRIATALTYFVGDKAWFELTVHGEMTYTVPDYTPVSLDGRKFIGWWDGTPDVLYHAGDTVSIVTDSLMMAQWSDEEKVALSDKLQVPIRALRALWQWIGLRIADASGR